MTAIHGNVKSSTGNGRDYKVNLTDSCFRLFIMSDTIIYNFNLTLALFVDWYISVIGM